MKHLSQFSIWEMIISHQENKFIKTKVFQYFTFIEKIVQQSLQKLRDGKYYTLPYGLSNIFKFLL